MKKILFSGGAALGVLGATFTAWLLLVVVVVMPSVTEQLGVSMCEVSASQAPSPAPSPGHGAAAAGQIQVLAAPDPQAMVGRLGADVATSVATPQTARAPTGYHASSSGTGRAGRGGAARVLWRTDRWSKVRAGAGPSGSTWVTLRSATAPTITVLALGTQMPATADLSRLTARLATNSDATLLVSGPTHDPAKTRALLAALRVRSSAQLLHRPWGERFVASPSQGQLRVVQHQVVDPGSLLVGLSQPGESTQNGAAAAPGTAPGTAVAGSQEGGMGFALPNPGQPRRASIHNHAQPIPGPVKKLYVAAAARYKVPWTLLAGVGMEETDHGRNNATSSAGADGLMQFMPATFARYGVDGDRDGRVDIGSDADSIFAAANYLTASGVSKGPAGVRGALFAYNHAEWYVNDVLTYAAAYGGGTVLGDPTDTCPANAGSVGNPSMPGLTSQRAAKVLAWGLRQLGEPYVFGSNGPNSWDCSSFTRTAYAQIGITLPRTAQAQRDWLAHGNGRRVAASQAQPGDLVFTDTYRGPNAIGHVMFVFDPTSGTSLEAGGAKVQHLKYTRYTSHHIFEIWRVGNLSDHAAPTGT